MEKGKTYILNAFSTNMLTADANVSFKTIDLEKAKDFLIQSKFQGREIISGVGHESTAKLMSTLLEFDVPFNRINVVLNPGDNGLIMSLGFRAEEGKIYTLEELKNFANAGKIKFYIFEVKNVD